MLYGRLLEPVDILINIREGYLSSLAELVEYYLPKDNNRKEIITGFSGELILIKIKKLLKILYNLELLNLIKRNSIISPYNSKMVNLIYSLIFEDDGDSKNSINNDKSLNVITWSTTKNLKLLQAMLNISLTQIHWKTLVNQGDSIYRLDYIIEHLYKKNDHPLYNILISTLEEMKILIENNCYISQISLCGRTLETCIKIILDEKKIAYDDNWMLGALLNKLSRVDERMYNISDIKNISNIINQNRIVAVHAKKKAFNPSKQQADLVLHATIYMLIYTLNIDEAAQTLSRLMFNPGDALMVSFDF